MITVDGYCYSIQNTNGGNISKEQILSTLRSWIWNRKRHYVGENSFHFLCSYHNRNTKVANCMLRVIISSFRDSWLFLWASNCYLSLNEINVWISGILILLNDINPSTSKCLLNSAKMLSINKNTFSILHLIARKIKISTRNLYNK